MNINAYENKHVPLLLLIPRQCQVDSEQLQGQVIRSKYFTVQFC